MGQSKESDTFTTSHQFLRTQTTEAHHELEKCSPLGPIINQSMADPVAYGNILLDFAELLEAFEARAADEFFRLHQTFESPQLSTQELKAGLFLNRRLLLQADLRALDLMPRMLRSSISRFVQELEMFGTEGWLGAAYVLQGQTLGSTLINRSLQACPIRKLLKKEQSIAGLSLMPQVSGELHQVHADAPFLFFHGHGLKTMPFWSEFLRTLEFALPIDQSSSLQNALAGALKVFQAFLTVWKSLEIL